MSIHPPFTALRSVQTVLDADDIPIALGAQDVHWEDQGAFTGEISPPMLAKLNVAYVIVGHSERRQYFGETDEMVNKKVAAVLDAGMTPIMCVGETLERARGGRDRRRGRSASCAPAWPAWIADAVAGLVVAYEPIWAIGTGRTATPEDAQTVCAADPGRGGGRLTGRRRPPAVRIQYGGSVKSANIADLMAQPDIDGALVGGASLDPRRVRPDRRLRPSLTCAAPVWNSCDKPERVLTQMSRYVG